MQECKRVHICLAVQRVPLEPDGTDVWVHGRDARLGNMDWTVYFLRLYTIHLIYTGYTTSMVYF